MFGLFKKKKKNVSIPVETNLQKVYINEENYNQVASFIDNVQSMEDCKLANTMIDDLGLPFNNVSELRNRLCDKTFETFAKEYQS